MTPSRPAGAIRPFLPVSWENNPMQKLGFFLLLVFLYAAYSRVLDLAAPSLHLPLVLSLMAFVATFLCGGIPRALSARIGKLLIAFTMWMVVCVPFSTWRRGSLGLLLEEWSK